MEAVFDVLATEQVLTGLRGIEVSGRDAHGTIEGTLELDVGGAPMRFSGQITTLDVDREAGALTMMLTGKRESSAEQSRCRVAVRLRSADGSTKVSMQLDVDIAGRDRTADAYPLREAVLKVVDDLALAVREHLTVAAAVGSPRVAATAAVDGPSRPETPPEPAAAVTPPARPARPRYADPGSPVPGRVVVVTSSPLDGRRLPVGDSATDRVRTAAGERPWLPPLVLLGILALLLLFRRRRSLRQD